MIIRERSRCCRSERASETQFDCIDGRTLTLAFKDVRMGREVVVGLSKTLAKRTTQCGPFLVAAPADVLRAAAAGSPSSGSSVSSSTVKTSYSSDGSETDSDDAEQSLLDALVEGEA